MMTPVVGDTEIDGVVFDYGESLRPREWLGAMVFTLCHATTASK